MDITTLTGIGASVFTAISLLPQLIKIIKQKKAEDISMWMLTVLFTGLALWVVYGVRKNDLIIIVANSFSLLINGAIVYLTIKYRSGQG
jgi:MtN3 and saliva related transmembrane protein